MSRTITSTIRTALLEKHDNTCQSCGATGQPLELAHIVPITHGGSNEINNLAILCRNCHSLLDSFQPREAEFSFFLQSVLVDSSDYSDVVDQRLLRNGYRADLTTIRKSHDRDESLLIELKCSSFFRQGQIDSAIEQIGRYRTVESFDAAALAFPGRVSKDDQAKLEAADIEAWDLDYVATTFAKEISGLPFSGFKRLYTVVPNSGTLKVSQTLLNRLQVCIPGKVNWSEFQKVVKDIFEHLFTPPLGSPRWESTDLSKVNRRDIIFPNYAQRGFWRFLRESYKADFIVIDSKNLRGKAKKTHVLQIANYLKPHGAGMFGVIACRHGGDAGCHATIREQWAVHGKLIVLLTDSDIRAMLTAATSIGRPEDVIGQTIEELRLTM